MTAEHPEFALRRERVALRSRMAKERGKDRPNLADARPAQDEVVSDLELGNFAALRAGDEVWVSSTPITANESRASAVAAALAWFAKQELSTQHRLVIVDSRQPGVTARVLSNFAVPATVFDADSVAAPSAHLVPLEPHASHLAFTDMFRRAGADVVIEHGVVAADVAGLEVARVVDEDGRATLRIGVGVHDRETFRMLHGDEATDSQLRSVVETVAAHRTPGAATHPLNLLAPERALRHRAVKNPNAFGFAALHIAEPPLPRANLKDSVPCCATGRTVDGDEVVAVFVAGVDLDAVPFAADARSRLSPRARLMIVSESRNIVPTQRRLAALLHAPAEFVSA